MKIRFTKMQGCGNDYVYVNGFTEHIPQEKKPEFVRFASDRHFGVGGDGVIFINPSDEADFEMEMYNADGTRAEMCGNGIRCVAKYAHDRVDMGEPILTAAEVPVVSKNRQSVDEEITVENQTYRMTCVSMGNPHAVVFVDSTADLPLEQIGPHFEHHERFPRRTNTEFVEIVSPEYVKMRVWERGTGETLACGTGCCATAVACVLNGKTGRKVTVEVLGGALTIQWDEKTNHIFMTGPAEFVFDGELEYEV